MTEVIVACEGRTEEAFINELVKPLLSPRAIYVQPRLIPTSAHAKGGALSRDRVLRFLRFTLKEREDTYVTTLFDLYGLPADFPGLGTAADDPLTRSEQIETALHETVVREARCRPERFVPHIQPYEFEALLFADPTAFGRTEPGWRRHTDELTAISENARSPEHINDGAETHPSARLLQRLHGYKKVTHGVGVAGRIGIERIRAECRHFDAWFARIEALTPLRTAM